MFDDLDVSDISDLNKEETKTYSNDSDKKNNWKNLKKKPEVAENPYIPIAIFIDRDFPEEIKTKLIDIASKLIAKKYTVRYNATEKEIYDRISGLSVEYTEAYIPWKNFNEIESKHSYNTLTSKHLAEINFSGWEKVPDVVKAMLASNVRLLFGDKNNSIAMCLITWSKDGASKTTEVTKDTGKSSFMIKLASTYSWPVLNIAKDSAVNILERNFHI